MAAILKHHARMEDIDVPELAAALAAHAGGEDTAPEASLRTPSKSSKTHAAPLTPEKCEAFCGFPLRWTFTVHAPVLVCV